MKNVNILSIIEAYRKLSNTLFQKLMNSYGIISGIKDYELNGIESFVNELLKIKNSITIVNNYYIQYHKLEKNLIYLDLVIIILST